MPWHEFHTNVRHLPTREQERVKQAFELGKKMHEGQQRKSGEPYFSHPIAVAHMLSDMGADADAIIAALLHDTVEDTPLTLAEIEREFGKDVATLIEGVTKLSKADIGEQPNLDEQIDTLRKIFTLMEKDIRIMVIKLVDRLHNMQTVEFLSPEKQLGLAKESMEVYVKIADRLCMQDLGDEMEALCLNVLEPEKFSRLSALRTQNETQGHKVLSSMQRRLQTHFPQHTQDVRMQYEHKSWENLQEQLQTEGAAVTGVSGISIAFICDNLDTCYRALGALHQMWQRELLSFQDFINAPAINGYRGLHTTIILEDGTRIRCKIRTGQMQEYARKGVASLCFREDMRGIKAPLPWTERISPLSQDNRERSGDFWGSLQSDILGESIAIHGPGDQTVLVPKGSTALDGAFYLFGNEATELTSLRIGGKETALDTRLDHGVSLDATLGKEIMANLSWLQKVKTGYATAAIRAALGRGKSDQEKILIGKDLLQRVMTDRKKGFIEEFVEEKLAEPLQKLGYNSLPQTYLAIANGRVDPMNVFRTLFDEAKTNGKKDVTQQCVVTFSIDKNNLEVLRRLLDVYQKYAVQMKNVRLWTLPGSTLNQFSLSIALTPGQQEDFMKDIKTAGGQNVEIVIRTKRELALIAAVIIPWALNPVFAKFLLFHGMTLLPLITVRLLTFSIFTIVLYVLWRFLSKAKLKPIPGAFLRAGIPALGNAGLTLSTYLALLFMPPSVHLTILRFNTLLIPLLTGQRKQSPYSAFTFLLLLALAAILLIVALGFSYFTGIALSVLALLFYTFYSLSTEHTLQQHKIDMRYPSFLLHMGLMLGGLGLVLAAFLPHAILFGDFTLPAILYVLVCVCIPHAAYSALLKTTRFKHFTDLLLLEVPISMFAEATLLGIVLSPFVYAAVAVILGTLLLSRWGRVRIPL